MTPAIRFGPARVPSREGPETAVGLLTDRNYNACEIDFGPTEAVRQDMFRSKDGEAEAEIPSGGAGEAGTPASDRD